jgi:hypothetical protein
MAYNRGVSALKKRKKEEEAMDGGHAPAASEQLSSSGSELGKLKSWVDNQKKNGLKDVKFFPGNVSDATVESFAREANALLNGKEVPITNLD